MRPTVAFKKVGSGYYELTRPIHLTHLDGREEDVQGLFEANLRDDEVKGWNLCISYEKPDGERVELSNYDEVYPTKREIAQNIATGVLDRWTRHLHLGWCI